MPKPTNSQKDKDKNFACCFCDTNGNCHLVDNTGICRYLNEEQKYGRTERKCGMFIKEIIKFLGVIE